MSGANKILSDKQKKFAMKYIETLNATESYLYAYPKSKEWSSCAAAVAGGKLKKTPTIAKYLKKLSERHMKKHDITVEKLLDELEEARLAAMGLEVPQCSSAVTATMSKAKLLGLDKQIIDHQSSDGSMGKPLDVNISFD
jgi:phage terminase small subunit